MKLKTTLLFLIIAGFLPLILAGSCRFYTDKDGNCVSKCVYPQIGNADTKTCLTDDSYCTQFFIQTYNVCSSQCPKGYAIKSAQGKKYQYCIPCQFQDENGKCYETCPFDMITDYTTQKCLSSPSQCQAYFIRDQQACISVCPPTYIVDNTQTPKLCVNCYASGACATNNDGNQKPSNDNNNNNNGIAGAINNTSCNLYLAANMYDCLPQCPQQQIALPQVQGQSYVQCQLCPPSLPYVSNDGSTCVSQCNTGEVLLMYNCMSSVSQCKFNVYTDDNKNQWCVKNCPPNLIPVQVKDQQYSICQSCPADKFFDPQLIQCVDTCPIQDATGKFCLPSIKSCNGYVSIDQKKCLANCPSDQYAENGQNFNQFQCVAECQKGHFILTENKDNIVYKYCVETCPFFQFAVNNQCSSINQCTNYLSMDGLTCLTSCPAGQFPQLLPTQKLLTCLPCMQKLSSDGKSCNDSCAADELYDVQLRQCQNSSQCTGIKQDGMCLTQCQLGYVLSMDSAIKTCVPISSCASYVSSDRQSCVKTCGTNEGIMPLNNQLFCVICPLGLDTDGISCKSKCPSSQIFDIASLSCKDINKCTGILSANGQRCVSECQFPEVKPSPQATQCAYKCESGQLLQENGVCIDPSNCTGYQSSNGQYCVQNCNYMLEIVGDSNSTPKTCQKCPQEQYPQIQQDGTVQCIDKDPNFIYNIQDRLKNTMSALGSDNITPIKKSTVKNTFQQITFDLEKQLAQVLSNPSVKTDQIQSLLNQGVQTLKTSILGYLDKLTSYDTATNIQQASDKIQDQNQLLLGSNKVQIVAEKKKSGYSFKLKFDLQDLVASSVVSLQQDDTKVPKLSNNSNNSNIIGAGIGDATGQTNSKITAMQITNLAVNPYCLSCPTGLTTVDAKTSGGRFRNLQSQSGQTYQLTYNVNPSQITKTICVSYDSNNVMTVNPTSINIAQNQITCTFTNNSSLYYDSNCQYISKKLCSSQKSSFNDQVSTNSKLLSISLAFVMIFVIYI